MYKNRYGSEARPTWASHSIAPSSSESGPSAEANRFLLFATFSSRRCRLISTCCSSRLLRTSVVDIWPRLLYTMQRVDRVYKYSIIQLRSCASHNTGDWAKWECAMKEDRQCSLQDEAEINQFQNWHQGLHDTHSYACPFCVEFFFQQTESRGGPRWMQMFGPPSGLFPKTRLLKVVNRFKIELIVFYTWWQIPNSMLELLRTK